MPDPVVEPISPAPEAPPVEPTNPGATSQKAPELSDELLRIPALQAVFAGAPPAVSASLKEFEKRPEAKMIAAHREELMKAGMGLYRSLSGDLGVIFNLLHIHPDQLIAADKAGQLAKIAPPFDVVNAETAKSGAAHPVLNAQVPGGAANAPLAAVPQSNQMVTPTAAPIPSGAPNPAHMANLVSSRPAAGPRPGAGRLLNDILKPVV